MAQDTEQPDHIIRSVTARARRTRRALSPWVQRCMGAEHGTVGSARSGGRRLFGLPLRLLPQWSERTGRYRRHRQAAFTAAPTRSLVGRVQRVVERGTVWRPNVGSLEPAMVARFADTIVGRFPPIGAKYQPHPSDAETAQETELPLAGGPMMLDLGPSPLVERSARPALSPTMLPPLPHQAAPTVQRTTLPPTLPKGARLFAQVEELPTVRETSIEGESPEGQLAQVGPAQAAQDTDASAGTEVKAASGRSETPPEPGQSQCQSDGQMPDQTPPRLAPRGGRPTESPRTEKSPPPLAAERPPSPILTQAASLWRLPLTKPTPITHREATAHLVARGWRFKRRESRAPAAPGLVARAVDDMEKTTSPGRPLGHKPQAMMKSVLGRDFGDVRIHTARLAPLNVQAATRGHDVYVEPGQDRFDTPESLSLLGHELTHVAQGGGIVSTKPVAQTAILPQAQAPARLESEEAEAESAERTVLDLFRPATVQRAEAAGDGASPSLPVSLVGWPASAERVQRQPFTSPLDTWEGEEELVEAAGEEEEGLPETEEMEDEGDYVPEPEEEEEEEFLEEEEPEKPDLDRLARQVYPFIKRLLAVERERMAR